MKVLIAEDDSITLDTVDACLRSEGFSTVLAADGKQALKLWETEKPDLICLDIMMPEIDGYDVCRQIRTSNPHLPILFLSAKNEEIDVVIGLELGADDFVRKPCGKHELLARICSVLRRALHQDQGKKRRTFSLGPNQELIVYPAELRAEKNGSEESINLSPREIAILELLHERAGEAVYRDEILDRCWGMDYFPESRTLDQHISNLRKRIEKDPANPLLIETIRGVGYRIPS